MDDAERIVRDLAAVEPVEENDWGVEGCALCDGYQVDRRAERRPLPVPAERRPHDESCPWRRAVEWVARQ